MSYSGYLLHNVVVRSHFICKSSHYSKFGDKINERLIWVLGFDAKQWLFHVCCLKCVGFDKVLSIRNLLYNRIRDVYINDAICYLGNTRARVCSSKSGKRIELVLYRMHAIGLVVIVCHNYLSNEFIRSMSLEIGESGVYI